MTPPDKTKAVLEQLLADLYSRQAVKSPSEKNSFLKSQDGQFLGRITSNRLDQESILNPYGPYGSRFSQTSIFNQYSPYGSLYGQFSINNPYSASPPQLFLGGQLKGHVSKNRSILKRIDPDVFLFLLKNDINRLLRGDASLPASSLLSPAKRGLYIMANDGAFLGTLDTNKFSGDSIFNQFSQYGNQYSGVSIFNTYGTYGGPYSSLSAFNEFTPTPPRIMSGDQFLAYLTKNPFLQPRVDPDEVEAWVTQYA